MNEDTTQTLPAPDDRIKSILYPDKVSTKNTTTSSLTSSDITNMLYGDKDLSSVPTLDTHTKAAILSGAQPNDLQWAQSQLGKKEYQGYCQSFVVNATGSGWKGSSAIDAWNRSTDKIPGTLQGIKPGDLLYFSANKSNENYGHTGIYSGDNKFISATDNGIAEHNLNDWNKMTGQDILGFIPK